MRARPNAEIYKAANQQSVPLCVSLTGGGPGGARIVCGFLGCDARPFNPLLAALPRVIHLPGSRQGMSGVRQLINLALAESTTPRPGSDGMLSRLSEVLFLEVVRFFTATLAPDQVGWFAALRDPTVGLALGRLHARAAQPWTLQGLARDIGTSRSVLAERFARLVGMPPLQYLARWRNPARRELVAHVPSGTERNRRPRRLRLRGGAEPRV